MTRYHVVTIALAMLAGPTAAATGGATDPDEQGSLLDLARLFSERPLTFVAGLSTASCGVPGHCSATNCNEPQCEPGDVPICNCVSAGRTCEEAHNPWNPFDNDTHEVFDCNCGCDDDDEPRPCRVRDPLNPEVCLVGEDPNE